MAQVGFWEAKVIKKRILLVDDEPQLLFSLKEFLSRVGHDVVTAESGPQALDLLVESPPDLIVSDILMEEMDGFEFQRRVNSLTGSGIPFIFLSAKGEVGDRLQGLRGGADDYITKPFEPEELEARIESILQRVEQIRQEDRRDLDGLRRRIITEVAGRLRMPVTSLMAHLNLLLSERAGEDEDKKKRYLESMLSDAQKLAGLIDELSRMASASDTSSRESIHKVSTRVAPVVRSAAATAARIANDKGIDLRVSCGGLLRGSIDASAMTRALSGLLKSATDLSPVGSQVQIAARRASDGGLEFVITDAGCDAASERPLESADALQFAQGVIKGHAGQISTRREEGRKQSFVIWLPDQLSKRASSRKAV